MSIGFNTSFILCMDDPSIKAKLAEKDSLHHFDHEDIVIKIVDINDEKS